MIKLKKRLPVLLMTAVIIPGLIISILGIYLVSQQKNARLLNVKNEFTNRLLRIQTNTEIQIRQLIKNTFQQIENSEINYSQPETLPDHIKNIALNNPIVKYPFFITSQNTFLFPFSKRTVLPGGKSPALDTVGKISKKRVKEFYDKGYNLEYKQRKFIDAVKFYLKSLQEKPGARALPYIYYSIARCYFKLNQFPQGANYYHKILHQFQDTLKKDKFLYFTILRQLAVSHKQIESVENAVKIYLQLYEDILNYEIYVKSAAPAAAFAFFKNEALDYLNRRARKESQKKGEDRVNPAKAIEQLEKASELDISLKWLYFEWEEEAGGTGKENETSRFSRLRELYEANDEKTQFYKAMKSMKEWSSPGSEPANVEIKQLKNRFSNRRHPFEIAFKPIAANHPKFNTIFFGFMLSFDFIKKNIIQPIARDELNDPSAFINVSDINNPNQPPPLLSVPFQTLLAGKILTLHSSRDDYFTAIVQRDIRLFYLLLFALIFTLVFGIILFYKYLSREAELVRLKSEFVDSASHTLKTPLTRISLLAENVKQGWVTGESRKEEFFNTIISETARMNEMIDNMLSFSRIEAGKQHYTPEKIYLQEITASIIDHYSAYIKELSLETENNQKFLLGGPGGAVFSKRVPPGRRRQKKCLSIEIDDHLPALWLDPQAIKLIIGNLLQNAIKYSPHEKYIKIRVYREKEFAVFEIEDKGIGIPKQEIPHIFKKFTRVSDNRVKRVEGSGLGLFLVGHAVDAHNGQIKVKSTPGKGTAFTIYFPLSPDLNKSERKRRRLFEGTRGLAPLSDKEKNY
jgi:signal transduction histidine kinase/tetratricopeptide (TPR) repeat protein